MRAASVLSRRSRSVIGFSRKYDVSHDRAEFLALPDKLPVV